MGDASRLLTATVRAHTQLLEGGIPTAICGGTLSAALEQLCTWFDHELSRSPHQAPKPSQPCATMAVEVLMLMLFLSLAALLGLAVSIHVLGLIVAVDLHWGSVSLLVAAVLLWLLLDRFVRWLERAAAEYDAFRFHRP